MRIAVSATRMSLDAPMDEHFGRCPCFVIADQNGTVYDLVDNPASGAEIQAVRQLVKRRVSVVLTGRCDPYASERLAAAGIEVITGCSGTVRQALREFTDGLRGAVVANGAPSKTDTIGGASSARNGVAPVTDEFAPVIETL